MQLSHDFPRVFKVEKIFSPRDFFKPKTASNPQYLEIGAGKGKHAIQFSQHEPNSILFAIERTQEKFTAFQKNASMHRLKNLRAVHADAIPWSVHALQPLSLSGVFILYPNPEPGNPNQRWINMPYFEFLLSRLMAGGKITLASNIATYVEETKIKAERIWKLSTRLTEVPDNSQRTHFEVKYLARGETCWQLELSKPAAYTTRFDEFSI